MSTIIHVIDIESTGTDPEKDRIVEIGCAKLAVEDGRSPCYGSTASDVVHPGIPIQPEASAIHHIIDADVAEAADIEALSPKYHEGADVFAAHNAAFDSAFLGPGFGPWICTLKCAWRLWPDAPAFGNNVLRYWLGIHLVTGIDRFTARMHRARPDACVTREVLVKMLEHHTVQDLIEMTDEPAKMPRFSFGKHRGEPLEQVPTSYLGWMRDQDFDRNTMDTVEGEISRRHAAR